MSVSIYSFSDAESINARRISEANRVVAYLNPSLPDLRLVVLLDGQDWYDLKLNGEENRGMFCPISEKSYIETRWPYHLAQYLVRLENNDFQFTCDAAIYLHNSTCLVTESLSMTLAHELQHAIQYANNRAVWTFNKVVMNLHKDQIRELGLTVQDVPVEREARILAKCVCEALLGPDATAAYIDSRIQNGTLDRDMRDWKFIKTIDTAAELTYDTSRETGNLFRRLASSRPQLEEAFADLGGYPDFVGLNLDDAFRLT